MEENKKVDRLSIMKNIILVAFVVILLRVVYMTTFKHEHYTELAENKTYKELLIKAPRGEIKDRYGRLIAGNKNLFTVQVSGDEINKKNSNGESRANEICLKLINLLEDNKEEYIDEFPIYFENGKYYYTFDKNIRDYKKDYNKGEGIPQELNAKETFYFIVDKAIIDGNLTEEDRKLEPRELQKKLNENGIYPPILVSKWMFTEEKNKKDWLESYKIKNFNISAKNAFKEIRNSKNYQIDKKLSDEDARKILIVRDLIKSQGYSGYKPVTIAKDISQKTIAQIEESAMELRGVSVDMEPVRYYPEGNLASHIIGYIGKMSPNEEEYYLTGEEDKEYDKEYYDGDKKYYKGDTLGKTAIEKYYEKKLKGEDGYKKVQVDALGRVTKELEVLEPKSGDTVYLSIDKDLQKSTEDVLKRTVEAARAGGTFESPFGNKSFSEPAQYAESGAIIAIDVKTGDVLSMASYPDYNPNNFINGISSDEWENFGRKNKNDVLSPSPQTNLVTRGVFQPGSTFKMVTGMAAIDNGLDPNYTIKDTGVIKRGEKYYGDYIWHKSRSNHGYTNLYKAIQESCNIYFYTIGSGKNWIGGKDPEVKIGQNDILEYAKKFGLDDYTGLKDEIYERKGKVPSVEAKLKSSKNLLRNFLDEEMENAFIDITKDKDEEKYDARIEEIVNWAEEGKSVGRIEAIKRLAKLNVKEDKIYKLADDMVYSYLNFANWDYGDTFNLAIGQGANQYTPAQMARYTAAIANGGDLVELSVVDRVISSDYTSIEIDENKKEKIQFNDNENLKYLTEGMKRVTTQSSVKSLFANFPISVAAKTGTAEKSGKIPTTNEYKYLTDHMASYGVSEEEVIKYAEKLIKKDEKKLSKEREKEIKKELESKDLKDERRKELEEELKEGVNIKIDRGSEKVKVAYLRQAIKKLAGISYEKIDQYKEDYEAFAWSVGFAPADDPEIAVVAMIPQGESSSYAMLMIREVMGSYFGLGKDKANAEESKVENDLNKFKNQDINFVSQMKK